MYISEFPAWALQLQRPDRRAVAVYHGGRIIARSRLLRQAGLLLGDPLDRARALYPDASFFDRDIPFEQAAWEGVLQQINEVTPCLQSLERGMAFFRPYAFSEACLLAERLIVQVGLGPNKSIARIAAVRSAPGSVLQIRAEAVQRFLSHTNVSVLTDLGFDEEIPSRLDLFGLTTLDKVAALTRRHLHAQFDAAGLDLFALLHPTSEDARVSVFVPPAAIAEVFAFDFSVSNLSLLTSVLNAIAGRAALRLGRFCCSRVTLRLSATDDAVSPRQARRILKNPTADAGIIARAANYLLQSVLASPFEASSIELTLSGLENPSHAQASLFFERPPLGSAIERLEQRFPGVIRRAVLVRPDAPFPEDSVALVPFLEAS